MQPSPRSSEPMGLMGLLIALRAGRVRLDMDADGLRINAPAGVLTPALRHAICLHKAALETLPHPFLKTGTLRAGELIISSLAPPQYHWQPISDTLQELDAPPEVWTQFRREKPEKTCKT